MRSRVLSSTCGAVALLVLSVFVGTVVALVAELIGHVLWPH
jgi:hypothetical protein